MDIEAFEKRVRATTSVPELRDLCRRALLHGTPHVFEGREEAFFDFRARIANKFQVAFHEVFIIGSAKLGFSPHKGTSFSLDSDIDVVIVSRSLFDAFMSRIRLYQADLRRSRRSVTTRELKQYHSFLEYTALGWIRPDKLPVSFTLSETKDDWFDFFRSISHGRSEAGNYKVAAGVFRSYDDLEEYLLEGLEEVRDSFRVRDQT